MRCYISYQNPPPRDGFRRPHAVALVLTLVDSEQKQTNVFLYICIGVAALVALGGQGILFYTRVTELTNPAEVVFCVLLYVLADGRHGGTMWRR